MVVKKTTLLSLCKTLGLTGVKSKTKDQLRMMIKDYEDAKKTKVIASGKNIKYIYHSADIHIRTLERHEEYSQVFNNLVNVLKSQENLDESVFVICGDIFHNRDRLVSETIILFNSFIEKLAQVIDIIMIPGNHDIFTHNDRLDTISGIVNIKKYQNFHFLKNSGVYCYNNVNFVVCSLVDNKFIRADEVEVKEGVKVCLYHGCVVGSKLDNGFSVPENGGMLKTSDFKGYDFVLLGDIHKRQFLKENIAYPGSLIQQNFKEHKTHGVIKWDIDEKKGEFLDVKNVWGYIVLKIKDGSFDTTQEFPVKSRVKLVHEYEEGIDYEKITKEIAKYTNTLSVSKEITYTQEEPEEKETCTDIPRNILDKKLFDQMVSSYDEETKKKLLALHINYLEDFEEDNILLKNSPWYIKSVEFKNVYIYGGDHINTVNFENKKGVIGILQQNAAGKSSVMNILLYCLFGHITKTKSFLNRNIINKNSNDYYIKMKIQMGAKEFVISRKGKNKTRKNKSKSMEEVLEFLCIEGENTKNLTDTNKVVTQEKIKETFALTEKEIFILTNVMNYSNYISILNMTSSDIGNVFSKLFNMEKYKEIHSKVLRQCKKIAESIKELDGQASSLEESLKDPATLNELEEIKRELELQQKKYEDLQSEIELICRKEASLNIESFSTGAKYTKKDLNTLEEELKDCEPCDLTLGEITRSIKSLVAEFPDRKEKIETSQEIEEIKNIRRQIKFHKIVRPCTDSAYKQAEKFLASFEIPNVEYSTTDTGDLIISQKDAWKIKTIIDIISSDSTMQKLVDSKTLAKEYKQYINLVSENTKLEEKYKTLTAMINYKAEQDLTSLVSKAKFLEISKKLEIAKKAIKNEETLLEKKSLCGKRQKMEVERASLKKEITSLTKEESTVSLLLKMQGESQTKLDKIKEKKLALEKEEHIYKLYKGIINDKVLPKMILKNTIKQVEKEANKMIYSLSGLMVFIADDDSEEGAKWEILVKKNSMILGSEQVSGYERFIINVGIKMALDKYKFYSGASIFFIDEAFDCVSEENLEKIDSLFDYLRSYYRNILIISHNEELKKKINDRIIISTDFYCSKIVS